MPDPAFLPSILAHAEAGAPEHAWRLFVEAGLEGSAEPAVLRAKGRLLKERGRAAQGPAQRALWRAAAEAYVAAGTPGDRAYALINAATLRLLAGDRAEAEAAARAVLALPEQEHETAYYEAATRAEALLVLGRAEEARAALAAAIADAPAAFEDHARTLRQFELVLAATGGDAAWLDALRPPRTLHYAGHMAPADERATAARIAEVLAAERVGVAFGALAAGADIVAAEAVLARGGELNLVLPGGAEAFRTASVEPYGADWAARFDRALARAASVRVAAPNRAADDPLAIRLAAEQAMGLAAMEAAARGTEAVQVVALDGQGTGASDRARAAWTESGRRQTVVDAPRGASPDAGEAIAAEGGILAALLTIAPEGEDAAARVAEVARAVAAGPQPLTPPRWAGGVLHLAYASAADAARAAFDVRDALGGGARAGAHYGIAAEAEDPFAGGPILLGAAAETSAAVMAAAPAGGVLASGTFAAALHLQAPGARTAHLDDLGGRLGPIELHAVYAVRR